jgi:hypothetical protein
MIMIRMDAFPLSREQDSQCLLASASKTEIERESIDALENEMHFNFSNETL